MAQFHLIRRNRQQFNTKPQNALGRSSNAGDRVRTLRRTLSRSLWASPAPMWTRILLAIIAVIVVATGAFVAYAWEPALAPVQTPDPASFDAGLKQRGTDLARLGNCNVCHVGVGDARQDGKAFAGGRALPTPFGTIYATNITPDPDTGIGSWSEGTFARAMHEGVDQQGRHLYPAFPYDHFTKLSDDDVKALYAFLMTREPVAAKTPANELPFPLNIRLAIAGWKLVFFHKGRFQPDANHDEAWNRGAYLADAVAHCGACHTPRNSLGARQQHRTFAGGSSEGWDAPALNAESPTPVPWNADSIFAYLRNGSVPLHGAAAGPMIPVVRNLAQVPEEDTRAIATYVASIAGTPTPERQRRADELIAKLNQRDREAVGHGAPPGAGAAPGREAAERSGAGRDTAARETVGLSGTSQQPASPIFAGACAQCHSETRPHGAAGAINLSLSTAVNLPDPRNAIRIVRDGLHPPAGERGALMPGFADVFSDAQIAELLAYVRARFSSAPAWSDLDGRVRRIGEGKDNS